jgi:AraC-like DNA-binding protein
VEAPAKVALEDCRIVRACDDLVEVVVGSPRLRVFPRRLSTGLGVCLKLQGPRHGVIAAGRALAFPGRSICVRPPGCVWSSDPVDAEFLSIDLDPQLLPEDAVFAPMTILSASAIAVASFVRRLLAPPERLVRDEALVELVDELASHRLLHADATAARDGGEAAVVRARERVGEELGEELGLDELARDVGCNKFLLLRAFKRRYGITPHAMRVCLRIEAARTLLAKGESPAHVAARVGFTDQSHFGRHFKRIVGLTPAAYRTQLQRARVAQHEV